MCVLAEIKRASPSKAWINPDIDAAEQGARYAAAGAAAIRQVTADRGRLLYGADVVFQRGHEVVVGRPRAREARHVHVPQHKLRALLGERERHFAPDARRARHRRAAARVVDEPGVDSGSDGHLGGLGGVLDRVGQ